MKTVCALLALTGTANGHVRMRYTGTTIRNGRGATGDGGFSVSGPCGGQNTFGANGGGTKEVANGDVVCGKIAYNGGHRSNANAFHATWMCGSTSQNDFRSRGSNTLQNTAASILPLVAGPGSSPIAAGTAALPSRVIATDSNRDGYTLCVNVPANAPALGKCTLSLLDQRDWGGCIDMTIRATPPPPTPPPTPPPPIVFKETIYKVSSKCSDCTYDCCPVGHIAVLDNGNAAVTFSLSEQGAGDPGAGKAKPTCDTTAFRADNTKIAVTLATEADGITASGTFLATLPDGERQEMTVSIRGEAVEFVNTGPNAPRVCDGTTDLLPGVTLDGAVASRLVTPEAVVAAGGTAELLTPGSDGDGDEEGGGGMSPVGQFFLAVFCIGAVGGAVLVVRKKQGNTATTRWMDTGTAANGGNTLPDVRPLPPLPPAKPASMAPPLPPKPNAKPTAAAGGPPAAPPRPNPRPAQTPQAGGVDTVNDPVQTI